MANQAHLEVLIQGIDVWNAWREQHPEIYPDLSEADLSEADLSFANLSKVNLYSTNLNLANLSYADLSGATLSHAMLIEATLRKTTFNKADLTKAELTGANLWRATLLQTNLSEAALDDANLYEADLTRTTLSHANLNRAFLSEADLTEATLSKATLSEANLCGAKLRRATLRNAILSEADLSEADLSKTKLRRATLVGTNLTKATLTECHIYGISAWDVELTGALQDSLVITPPDEPIITVDNLKLAQFICLFLHDQEIRDVIDTIARKAVLILGRFTPERKAILDALRNILHTKDYVPIMVDFEKSASKDTHETITPLARLARFVIADITEAKSIPQEFVSLVESLPSLAIQPLLQRDSEPWDMYDYIQRYPWVLPIHRYTDLADLLATLEEGVIDPAERKAQELTKS